MLRFLQLSLLLLATLLLSANEDSLKKQIDEYPQKDTVKVWLFNTHGNEVLKRNPIAARASFKAGKTLAEQLDFFDGTYELTKNLGTTYFYTGDFDSTYYYWRQVADMVPYHEITKKADAFNNLAVYFQQAGHLDSSLYYHNASLQLKSIEKDSVRIAYTLSNLAGLYRQKGRYEKAFDYYFLALELYRNANLPKQESDVLNGIGLLYKNLSNFEEAGRFLEQALLIRERIGDQRGILSSLINLSTIYTDLKEYGKAEEISLRCVQLAADMSNTRAVAGVYLNLGVIYADREKFDKSLMYYKKALMLFTQRNDKLNIGLTALNIGFLKLEKGAFKAAVTYFLQAEAVTEVQQALRYKENVYNGLAEAYMGMGAYKNATAALDKLITIKDSLYTQNVQEKIGYYQEKFEAQKRENEIVLLEQDALISDQKLVQSQQTKNSAILLAVLIFLTLIFVYYLYILRKRVFIQKAIIHQKEKEQLENEKQKRLQELAAKNRELTSFATYVVQKNELIDQLKESIQSIQQNTAGAEALKRVEDIIRTEAYQEKDWNTFKIHFENVQPYFFERLQNHCPKLSSNDLRICAYLKMNLSTKEIAALMNITPKSVRMNKYRLKKKLKLAEDEKITAFLQTFTKKSQLVMTVSNS